MCVTVSTDDVLLVSQTPSASPSILLWIVPPVFLKFSVLKTLYDLINSDANTAHRTPYTFADSPSCKPSDALNAHSIYENY